MPERSERLVLGLCVVLAVVHVAAYLTLSLQRIAHPFELEWMESGSLEHVLRVLRGEPLYPAPSIEFVPFPYPPLYYWVSAGVVWLVGPELLSLRIVSWLSSLATAGVVFQYARRETGSLVWAVIGAGTFLATWRASGLYLDVARLDSLFTFLLLLGVYALRFWHDSTGRLAAAAIALACVMTKQTGGAVFAPLALWCVWADWQERGRRFEGFREWSRTREYALPLLGITLAATAALELAGGGHFLRYVLGVQPGHGVKWSMIGGFFWSDLGLTLPLAALLAGVWLGLLGPGAGRRSREEERAGVFHAVVLAGVLVACLVPRIKVGGAANNLIPAYAWLGVLLPLAATRLIAFCESERPSWSGRVRLAVAAGAVLQLLLLLRWPADYLPSEADRAAGAALANRVAGIQGEVLMPVQGHVASAAGKRVFAHQMPVSDYASSGLEDASSLVEGYARAIREQRFAAVVDSNTAFLRNALPEGLLEEHYRLVGWLFENPEVLVPISGARIRAGTLWVPRGPHDRDEGQRPPLAR